MDNPSYMILVASHYDTSESADRETFHLVKIKIGRKITDE